MESETYKLGNNSFAEGTRTKASGNSSHAEGYFSITIGNNSHAEGTQTTAKGGSSHAEGNFTIANGNNSHTEGFCTIASSDYQHVQGKYNIEDKENKYIHIVGNGTFEPTRSNAHTIDFQGNSWYQGVVKVGGTSQDDPNAQELATKEYVNSNLHSSSSIPIGTGMDYFGIEAPEGYLFADGMEVSRIDYSELFEVIGTTYGEGDGDSTFNLPDKRECVSIMRKEDSTNGTEGATLDTLGAKGGEFKHVLSKEELPNYNLTVKDPGHSHALARVIEFSVGNTKYGPAGGTSQSANINTFSAKTGITVSSAGNDVPMNNLQPYLVCNYIIKVK